MHKKILVMGPSGSGKSTFAKKAAEKIGVSAIHFDMETRTDDYQRIPKPLIEERFLSVLAEDRWVIDGNYTSTLFDERLLAADVIIYLHVPTLIATWRALKRSYRVALSKEQPTGNPKAGNIHLIWVLNMLWDYPRKKKKVMFEKIHRLAPKKLVVLTFFGERDEFLNFLS